MTETRYYKIIANYGHLGRGKAIDLTCFIKAGDMIAALEYVTEFGGGIKKFKKRKRLEDIKPKMKGIKIEEVSLEEYTVGVKNMDDWYNFHGITDKETISEERLNEKTFQATGKKKKRKT